MARLNLKLAEKDLSIKGLHEQLERGEAAEHLKNIKAEVEMCQREKEVEIYEHLPAYRLIKARNSLRLGSVSVC